MLRYKRIVDNYYYDCAYNRIIESSRDLSDVVTKNRIDILPAFSEEDFKLNLMDYRQQLILSVTESCNLRCKYCAYYDCRYDKENYKYKEMNFEIAKIAIDEYIEHSEKAEKRCISFYGGEPLLNFALIKRCVEYVNSLHLNKEMLFLITTNALLMNEEIADFLYENKFNVNISLDGPELIHNRYRKTVTGEDTFERIIKNIQLLISRDYDFYKSHIYFLCVLAPPKALKSILDYFAIMPYGNQYSKLMITEHMKRELIEIYNSGQRDDPEIRTDIYPRERVIKKQGIARIKQILRQNPFTDKSIIPGGYCLPMVRRLFVASDGGYYMCEKCDQTTRNCYGNVFDGIDIAKLMKRQEEIFAFHDEKCKDCWALRFCNVCYASVEIGRAHV